MKATNANNKQTTPEPKGQSKVTTEDVLNIRRMKVANPDMSAEAIKRELGLELSGIMVGRAIRGISHSHIDMCGLPVRPFNTTPAVAKRAARKATAKAAKAAKAVVVEPISYEVARDGKGSLAFTPAQALEVKRMLTSDGMSRKAVAAKFNVSLSSIARLLTK